MLFDIQSVERAFGGLTDERTRIAVENRAVRLLLRLVWWGHQSFRTLEAG